MAKEYSKNKIKSTYRDGRISRLNGNDTESCPYPISLMQLRSWWLAGWHDVDMECGR